MRYKKVFVRAYTPLPRTELSLEGTLIVRERLDLSSALPRRDRGD